LNQWAELGVTQGHRFAHKALLKASNPFIERVVNWIAFLLSETKYGFWRDTSMHHGAIRSLLKDLGDKILRFPCNKTAKLLIAPTSEEADVVVGSPLSVKSCLSFPSIRRAQLSMSSVSERSRIPPAPSIAEPYPGGWLKVGDAVEELNEKNGMFCFDVESYGCTTLLNLFPFCLQNRAVE